MGDLESKLHAPGVMIFRAKGNLTADNFESWRDDLEKFVKEHREKGACGVLIDLCQMDSFSAESIDALIELMIDPEEIIRDVRMRFAFIGVKPFTQRFLRETMPLDEVKHIRARFFHEVAETEALAWLTAMVSSAEDRPESKPQPEAKPEAKPDAKAEAKPPAPIAPDGAGKEPAKPASPTKIPAFEKPSEPAPAKTPASKADPEPARDKGKLK